MKSRVRFLSGIAAILCGIVLFGCGGGGGGGGGTDPVNPLQYTGKTSEAPLASTREGALFSSAVMATSAPDVDTGVAVNPAGSRFPGDISRTLVRIGRQGLRNARTLSSGGAARPMGSDSIQVHGAEGGTLTITIFWNDSTGIVTSATASASAFDDTLDGIPNPIHGLMTLTFTRWDAWGDPTAFRAEFPDLRDTGDDGRVLRYGGRFDSDESDPSRITIDADYVVEDMTSKAQIWLHPISEVLLPGPIVGTLPSTLVSVSGTLYLSDYGAATVETLAPLRFRSGEAYPDSGSLRFSRNDGRASTSILNRYLPEVESGLDSDGDGVPEVTAWYSWEELLQGWIGHPRIVSVLTAADSPSHLSVLEGAIFWSDPSLYPVKRILVGGGTSEPLALRTDWSTVGALAVRGEFLYWTRIGDHPWTLFRTSLDGSSTIPLLTSSGEGYGSYGTTSLAVDDSYVYLVTTSTFPLVSSIVRVPLGGGTPTTMVTTSKEVRGIATDGTTLYWQESQQDDYFYGNAGIRKMPVSGGPISVVSDGLGLPTGGFVLSGNELFFGEQYSGFRIRKISVEGGTVTTLADLASPPVDLAAEGGFVCWLDAFSIGAVPAGGGAVTTLVSGFSYLSHIGLHNGEVYWPEPGLNGAGVIRRIPVTGGTPSTAVSGLAAPGVLAFQGADLFWGERVQEWDTLTTDNMRIARLPGGGGSPVTVVGGLLSSSPPIAAGGGMILLADEHRLKGIAAGGGPLSDLAPIGDPYQAHAPHTIATDGAHLYWIDGEKGELARIPLVGGGIEVLALVSPSYIEPRIRMDSTYVYYKEGYSIRRVPKAGGASSTVVTLYQTPQDFAVEGAYVYYIDGDIWKVPAGGGSPSLFLPRRTGSYSAIAIDGPTLYWRTELSLGSAELAGGVPRVINISSPGPIPQPDSIAFDASHVYWIDGSGEIRKTTK